MRRNIKTNFSFPSFMKRFFALLGSLAFVLGNVLPTSAFFSEDVDTILENSSGEKVEGLSVTSGNGSAILVWNTKFNADGIEASKYRVDYGTVSVEEGLADSYELTQETNDNIPSESIKDLAPGKTYFFRVVALYADKTESVPSAESSVEILGDFLEEIKESPVVVSATQEGEDSVVVTFSKDILLPEETPELFFTIENKKDPADILEVKSAVYKDPMQKTEVLLQTIESFGEKTYRVTASAKITDIEGNPVESGSTDSAIFGVLLPKIEVIEEVEEIEPIVEEIPEVIEEVVLDIPGESLHGAAEDEEDLTPPEDVTDLKATKKARSNDFLVNLKWKESQNTDEDLADQLFYRSDSRVENKEQWSASKSLGADVTSTTSPEKPLTDVAYKITVTDEAGNESVGRITSISLPALPQTGGTALVLFAGLAFLGMGVRQFRKKK